MEKPLKNKEKPLKSREKKQIKHLKFSESPYKIAELKQVKDTFPENNLTCNRLKYIIQLQNSIKINELYYITKKESLMISTKFFTYSILNSYIHEEKLSIEDGDQE